MKRYWIASSLLPVALAMTGCGHLGAKAEAQPKVEAKQMVRLDGTVLNLADAGANTYLRIGVSVAMGAVPSMTEGDNKNIVASAARDTVVAITTSKTAADLLTPDGKDQLKHAIQAELQKRLPQFHVEDIYFDEFLIQH